MHLSLNGALKNAALDIQRSGGGSKAEVARRAAVAVELKRCAWLLWALSGDRASGEAAIDRFFAWYLRALPLTAATHLLPKRPTRAVSQPKFTAFSLDEIHRLLLELLARKAEGRAVIEEFFTVCVFETAPEEVPSGD